MIKPLNDINLKHLLFLLILFITLILSLNSINKYELFFQNRFEVESSDNLRFETNYFQFGKKTLEGTTYSLMTKVVSIDHKYKSYLKKRNLFYNQVIELECNIHNIECSANLLSLNIAKIDWINVKKIISYNFIFYFFFVVILIYSIKELFLKLPKLYLIIFCLYLIFYIIKAFVTGLNHGPDEAMHYPSFFWYLDNWMPPSIANSDIYKHKLWKTSYVYGVYSDLSYLITAKVSSLLSLFYSEHFIVFRISQILIFAIFPGLIISFAGLNFALTFILSFIIIPQLSFTIFYLNGDILSYCFSFLGISIILASKDIFKNFYALFLILNSKLNYISLLPIYLIKLFKDSKNFFILLFVLVISCYRKIFNYIDQFINNTSYLKDIINNLLEDMSIKNHTSYNYVIESYQRVEGGISNWLWEITFDFKWYATSIRSMIGVFGFLNKPCNIFLILFCLGLLFYIFVKTFSSRKDKINFILIVIINIVLSLVYSMSNGAQPQGRYLFPILCYLFANFSLKDSKTIENMYFFSFTSILAIYLYD